MKDYGHGRRITPDLMREDVLQLPTDLNEHSIASHLRAISRTSPDKLPGTVRAIREVWAHKMGSWVERGRLDYLDTVLSQLKISHEILAQCLDMDAKWMAHQDLKLNRQEERSRGIPGLEAEAKAEEIRTRIEAARAQQAEHKSKRASFENPPAQKREPSAEERRQENFKHADEKLRRLIRRKEEHLAELLSGRSFDQLSPEEQEEYREDENIYNERIRRAKEERLQHE